MNDLSFSAHSVIGGPADGIWLIFSRLFIDPGKTFSDFGVSWRQAGNVMIFRGTPEFVRIEDIHPGEGNSTVQGSRGRKKEGVS